jgi:hypothetical protein
MIIRIIDSIIDAPEYGKAGAFADNVRLYYGSRRRWCLTPSGGERVLLDAAYCTVRTLWIERAFDTIS